MQDGDSDEQLSHNVINSSFVAKTVLLSTIKCEHFLHSLPFKDEAQTAWFEDPVRTAL
jgi:hypothetical protein